MLDLHKKYGEWRLLLLGHCRYAANARFRAGPVVRITPTLLVVNDTSKLPTIYSRYADKSKHYLTGSFGKTESVFNMQDQKQHAHFRKIIAGPVFVPSHAFVFREADIRLV